jgi:hypothetical protein
MKYLIAVLLVALAMVAVPSVSEARGCGGRGHRMRAGGCSSRHVIRHRERHVLRHRCR